MAGTYSGDDLDVEYATDDTGDEQYDKQDFTVTVSRLDAVDGLIEGTFFGTVHDDTLGTIAITDGSFRVVRVEQGLRADRQGPRQVPGLLRDAVPAFAFRQLPAGLAPRGRFGYLWEAPRRSPSGRQGEQEVAGR